MSPQSRTLEVKCFQHSLHNLQVKGEGGIYAEHRKYHNLQNQGLDATQEVEVEIEVGVRDASQV